MLEQSFAVCVQALIFLTMIISARDVGDLCCYAHLLADLSVTPKSISWGVHMKP